MTKQLFMEQLFHSNKKFKIINGIALLNLPKNRTVKVSIETLGTSGTYQRLHLKIINNVSGLIDDTSFPFDSFLKEKKPDSRCKGLMVIEHCGWHWYINEPTTESVKELMDSITDYISNFK